MTTHMPDGSIGTGGAATAGSAAPRATFIELLRKIIGVPDYETYRKHMATCHPDQSLMTEAEFADERLTNKYSKPGQRCC